MTFIYTLSAVTRAVPLYRVQSSGGAQSRPWINFFQWKINIF